MLHNRIREIRLKNGITQTKLAKDCSASLTTIKNVEKGIQVPSVELALKIYLILNSYQCDLITFNNLFYLDSK